MSTSDQQPILEIPYIHFDNHSISAVGPYSTNNLEHSYKHSKLNSFWLRNNITIWLVVNQIRAFLQTVIYQFKPSSITTARQ